MQHFLREQQSVDRKITKSVNFLHLAKSSLVNYHKIMCKYNIPIANKILDFVIELI